jgi:hypothetical protein
MATMEYLKASTPNVSIARTGWSPKPKASPTVRLVLLVDLVVVLVMLQVTVASNAHVDGKQVQQQARVTNVHLGTTPMYSDKRHAKPAARGNLETSHGQ